MSNSAGTGTETYTRAEMAARVETAADALLVQARKDYERCRDAWQRNQEQAREDLRFARLGEQWPAEMAQQRKRENRPCLTFNKMPAFIRQVVNDARQNSPRSRSIRRTAAPTRGWRRFTTG